MLAQQIQILDDMFKELEKNVKDAYDISCKLKVQTYLICYIDYAYKSVQKCKQVITDLKRSFENRSELLKYSSIESVVKNEEMINTGSKFKEDNYNVDKEIGDNLEFELKDEDILKYSELNESTNDYTITEETKVSDESKSKCIVCGGSAKIFNYGALICSSCKIFFKRNFQKTLSCKDSSNNCKITLNSRINCKLCRYNKCINVGMKPKQNVVQKGAIKFKSGIKNKKIKEELSNQRKSEALIMHLKGIKRVHKFKQEEILSALENENYEYFIIGMTKDGGEIVKQCGICLSTVIRTKMENHIKSHFNVVICSECGGEMLQFLRKLHQQTSHMDKCKLCRRYVRNINEHMCIEKKVSGKLECVICKKSFTRKRYLSQHKNIWHSAPSENKEFCCDICGKSFKIKQNLTSHRFKHNKFYDCVSCSVKFKDKRSLTRHNFIKHSEKGEFCDKCGENVFSLKPHLLAHHGERNVSCNLCDKKFLSGSALNKHIRMVHEKSDAVKCAICNKEFSCKSVLPKHMRNVHKVNLTQKEISEKKISTKSTIDTNKDL